MALRRSRVRISLGPPGTALAIGFGICRGQSLGVIIIKIKSHGRSSRSSRQRDGRARWKPVTAHAGAPNTSKVQETELACHPFEEAALVKRVVSAGVARYSRLE